MEEDREKLLQSHPYGFFKARPIAISALTTVVMMFFFLCIKKIKLGDLDIRSLSKLECALRLSEIYRSSIKFKYMSL